jgi:antitoxin component YwqK of YwqJK toxin-antitoxin module
MRGTIVAAAMVALLRPSFASPPQLPEPDPSCESDRVIHIALIRCPARTTRAVACPADVYVDMPSASDYLADAVVQWCVPDAARWELRGVAPLRVVAPLHGVAPLRGGAAVGPYLVSYADGKPAHSGRFRRGRQSGVWTKWYPNGVRASVKRYDNGWLHGRVTEWYDNGKRALTGAATHDRRRGTWRWWNADGALAREVGFADDLQHGRETVYYPDGTKSSEKHYRKGVAHGRWTEWWPDGRMKLAASCRNGDVRRRFRMWNPDGTILVDRVEHGEFELSASIARHGSHSCASHVSPQACLALGCSPSRIRSGAGDR